MSFLLYVFNGFFSCIPPLSTVRKEKVTGKVTLKRRRKRRKRKRKKWWRFVLLLFLFFILNWFFLIRSFLLIKCWSKLILYKFVLKNKTSLFPQLSTLAVLIFNETTIVLFIIWSAIFLILWHAKDEFPTCMSGCREGAFDICMPSKGLIFVIVYCLWLV